MHPSTGGVVSANAPAAGFEEPDLHALQVRVSAEFREMPGLRLTLAQAARLFGIDEARCACVLGALVARGVVATDGCTFVRRDPASRGA
jgi:hypothetical protein